MQFVNPIVRDGDTEVRAEVGSPVRLHHVPAWLRRRLLAWCRAHGWNLVENCGSTYGPMVLQFVAARLAGEPGFRPVWLDHWGSVVEPGGERAVTPFVSEPYTLSGRDMLAAIHFAREMECELFVDATSWHFPTRTLRLTFKPREET